MQAHELLPHDVATISNSFRQSRRQPESKRSTAASKHSSSSNGHRRGSGGGGAIRRSQARDIIHMSTIIIAGRGRTANMRGLLAPEASPRIDEVDGDDGRASSAVATGRGGRGEGAGLARSTLARARKTKRPLTSCTASPARSIAQFTRLSNSRGHDLQSLSPRIATEGAAEGGKVTRRPTTLELARGPRNMRRGRGASLHILGGTLSREQRVGSKNFRAEARPALVEN